MHIIYEANTILEQYPWNFNSLFSNLVVNSYRMEICIDSKVYSFTFLN